MGEVERLLEVGDDYSDWRYAFAEPGEDGLLRTSGFGAKDAPEVVPPGADVSGDWFSRSDVAEVLHIAEGENDGGDWVFVGKLRDGRYASISAWCDYTGWG